MTKKEKTEKCKYILNKYPLNETVTDKDEFDFLISIFENHNEWKDKKGNGIQSISIAPNDFNRCFQLNRFDRTYTDISYRKCLYPPTKNSIIKEACREAIKYQKFKFKDENVIYGITRCEVLNIVLTKENTHIDHYDLTFDDMYKLWIKNKDIDYLYSQVNVTKDNEVLTYFTNESIKVDFIEFHNKNCKLRAVSNIANLSNLKINKL